MSEQRMSHAEFEGLAVAYAMLVMRFGDAQSINEDVLARFGPNHLRRVKKRAWQHIRSNAGPREPGEGGGA